MLFLEFTVLTLVNDSTTSYLPRSLYATHLAPVSPKIYSHTHEAFSLFLSKQGR